MNPIIFAMRRPITIAMTVVALCSPGGLALARMRVDVVPPLNTPSIYVFLDYIGMSPDQIEGFILTPKEVIAALANQRATFETLDKRYAYVVGKDDVVHQLEIVIQNEMEDIFVIKKRLHVGDRIVFEGIRQVREGERVEHEFRLPEQVITNQKNNAE
jgi:AcrB/AcrD/AcrF family